MRCPQEGCGLSQPELKRSIGLVRATAMVIGTIIGASIFVQPSVITGAVPSAWGVYLVWMAAGVLTFFGALASAELASAFPRTGGVYVFLSEAYSPPVGFLWGWAMFWSMHSGIIAAIAVIFARYAAHFIPMGPTGLRVAAIGCILVLSAVNYFGVRQGSALQTAFTMGKIVAILAIIAAGFLIGGEGAGSGAGAGVGLDGPGAIGGALTGASPAGEGSFTLQAFALALVAGLFAFGGWHMVTYAAEETIRPERTIPRALLIGTLTVTACYIAMNAVYMHVLPLDRVIASERIAADAADVILGSGGAGLMSGLVVFSTFGALSGIILAGPRVYYSMANDGLIFRWLGGIHPRFRTPHRAIALQAVWSSVLVATGTYQALFTRVVYTEWIFFAMMAFGLFRLRRRRDYRPSYRIWGYPIVPAIFVLASAAIVFNQIVGDPGESAFGLALVLVGLPVYYFWVGRHSREKEAFRGRD
ncbi:APC family permease [Gemmatimonadota bacterium]